MKKKFGVYFLIISLVLLGLLWIQYFWIEYSIQLKNNEFKKALNSTLNDVSGEIERSYFCFSLYADLELDKEQGFYMLRQKEGEDNWLTLGANEWDQLEKDTVKTFYFHPETDSLGYVSNFSFDAPIRAKIALNFEFDYERTLLIDDTAGGMKDWVINSYRNTLTDQVTKFRIVDTLFLKDILHKKLTALGLDTNYQFGISKLGVDTLLYAYPTIPDPELMQSEFSKVLYDDKTNFADRYLLHVFVPNWNILLMKNLWFTLLSSIAVVIVLIWMLFFFIRIIMNQRKLNEMKSDFINNMTHEFNTPVSNIGLALDTIEQQSNGKDNDRIWKIIKEENKRIQENIALILETAYLEKKKMNINKEWIDLKQLIDRVIHTFQLKVEENGGKLTTNFPKEETWLKVDEVHLVNLIHNLVDNAIKYSREVLDIEVILKKMAGNFTLVIKDKGIGIKEDDLHKVFDKFYRVSTGKVHDVKGFGLGLHYVQLIVEAHRGMIEVKSKIGRGSEFIVLLPEQ